MHDLTINDISKQIQELAIKAANLQMAAKLIDGNMIWDLTQDGREYWAEVHRSIMFEEEKYLADIEVLENKIENIANDFENIFKGMKPFFKDLYNTLMEVNND